MVIFVNLEKRLEREIRLCEYKGIGSRKFSRPRSLGLDNNKMQQNTSRPVLQKLRQPELNKIYILRYKQSIA